MKITHTYEAVCEAVKGCYRALYDLRRMLESYERTWDEREIANTRSRCCTVVRTSWYK
jgi:hypothetical protein